MNHRSAPRLVALQKALYESLKEKATEVCASGNWADLLYECNQPI